MADNNNNSEYYFAAKVTKNSPPPQIHKFPLWLFGGEGDEGVGVAGGGDNFGEEVDEGEYDAGCVDAGMAGVDGAVAQVIVDNKPDFVAFVVYQSHGRYGAGVDVEQLLHGFGRGERQPRAAQLAGKELGFERLVGGNHEEVEVGHLPIGEKQILEHRGVDGAAHGLAFFHGEGCGVAARAVAHARAVEKVVDCGFDLGALDAVGRPPLKNGYFIHSVAKLRKNSDSPMRSHILRVERCARSN